MKRLSVIILAISLLNCKKTEVEVTPAKQISGIFEAKTYDNGFNSRLMNYPINGQSLKIDIKYVSQDTVSVHLISTVNGFYSPGIDTTFSKVYVVEDMNPNRQQPKIFRLKLAPPVNISTLENSIWFDSNLNAYYSYIPPNYKLGAVQTVFAKTN